VLKGRGKKVVPVALITVGLAACTSTPPLSQPTSPASTSSPPGSSQTQFPKVAEVICSNGAVSLSTPVVAVERDGVHFEINNMSDRAVVFYPGDPKMGDNTAVEYADHGDNTVLAHSVEAMRWEVPPGTTTVVCVPSRDFRAVASPLAATLEISDPENLYVPIGQDFACDDRVTTYGFYAVIDFTTSAEAYAAVRREIRGIRADDVLQRAGYPDQPHVWVWILRQGAKVALVNFGPVGTSTIAACRDSGIRPR
jgi:hypothetical protein